MATLLQIIPFTSQRVYIIPRYIFLSIHVCSKDNLCYKVQTLSQVCFWLHSYIKIVWLIHDEGLITILFFNQTVIMQNSRIDWSANRLNIPFQNI